jgi:hypothetical protein
MGRSFWAVNGGARGRRADWKQRHLRFEPLEERRLLSVTGDYNADFAVNAADYVVWRKAFGETGAHPADGNGDLVVNDLDFNVWRENHGNGLLPGPFNILPPPIITEDDFTIEWEASPNATSYELILSQNATDPPYFKEVLSGTSRSFTNFGNRDFFVGVIASNGAGSKSATNQGSFGLISVFPFQTIFVSSSNYFIDDEDNYPPLGGLFGSSSAADYHTTFIANEAGLIDEWNGTDIVFFALLTETLTDLPQRAGLANSYYLNVLGDLVAADRDQLLSGQHTSPILTQTGIELAGTNIPVWTGSTPEGTWSGFTAEDWSTTQSTATVGNLNGEGSAWISNGTRSSQFGARLYGIGVPDNLPPRGTPTLTSSIADQSAAVGSPFSLNLADHFDAGQFPITFIARQSSGLPLPAWLTCDRNTGTLSGTPSAGDVGTLNIEVAALARGSAYEHFTLLITAPAAASNLSASTSTNGPSLAQLFADPFRPQPRKSGTHLGNSLKNSIATTERESRQSDAALLAWLSSQGARPKIIPQATARSVEKLSDRSDGHTLDAAMDHLFERVAIEPQRM